MSECLKTRRPEKEACPECGAGYALLQHLDNRLTTGLNGTRYCQMDYMCLICKATFTNIYGLAWLGRIIHKDEENEYEQYTEVDISEIK